MFDCCLIIRVIFKIVPMLNPDGVILGNYRTNLTGRDLNRVYHCPSQKQHPTIFALKQLVNKYKFLLKKDVFASFDFHGHSRKKGVFMYGVPFPRTNKMYYKVRIIPKLLSDMTEMFRYAFFNFYSSF